MTFDRAIPPAPGPAPVIEELGPARFRLDDGMRVVWLDRPRLPEVSLRLVVPGGVAGGAKTAGLASLVGRLLTEGAGGLDARDLAIRVDALGVQLAVSVNHDATVLRLHLLSELLVEGLDLLHVIALQPDFPPADVERCRAERIDHIRRLRDDPSEVSSDLVAELVYGEHPYGRLPRGRVETVRSVEREDLVAFHRGRYAATDMTLVAVGDLGGNRFPDLVEERFGGTPGQATPVRPPARAKGACTTGIALVDRPASRQSVITIAGVGCARGDAEEPTARVGNAILGGLFNSRLNMNLREDKGWTYGARSTLSLRRSAGPVTIRAAVETGVTAEAVREMTDEARRMCETEPSAEEMALAEAALTRSLPLRFERASQVADLLVDQVLYGLPDDYWTRFPEAIRAVSAGSVREWAEGVLDPSGMVTVVVGPAPEVREGLEELGPVTLRAAP